MSDATNTSPKGGMKSKAWIFLVIAFIVLAAIGVLTS
jgi:flagellar basal body-associated protein FliL